MKRCPICRPVAVGDRPPTWIWQPFGPGESIKTFTLPGSHYRGFAAIGVCDFCKADIERDRLVGFRYRRLEFVADGRANTVRQVPG